MTTGTIQVLPEAERAAIGFHWREYAIEAALLGFFMISACTFTIIFEHPSSPVHRTFPWPLVRRALVGVAMGVTAVMLIYSPWGKRSGAHMNPAVTLCFLRLGKIEFRDAGGYIAAQFLGGALGVFLCRLIASAFIAHPAVNYIATLPGAYGEAGAWLAEFAISLLLMSVILGANRFTRLMPLTGWLAGALVALYITFEAPLSGMSLNPARSLGSAVIGNIFTGIWIYFTAPVMGMLLAVELHHILVRHPQHICGKLSHCRRIPCIFKCNCLNSSGIEAR